MNRQPIDIDRIACKGHGICAALAPHAIELDEWGYPIVRDGLDTREANDVVTHCPVRAVLAAQRN